MNESLPEMEFESPDESQIGDEAQPDPKITPHDLDINILGTSFSITAGEDPAYLEDVLSQYQFAVANTQGISGMKDPLKVAILTGFLLCDEINKLKIQVEEEQAGNEQALGSVTRELISRIDQVFEETDQFDD